MLFLLLTCALLYFVLGDMFEAVMLLLFVLVSIGITINQVCLFFSFSPVSCFFPFLSFCFHLVGCPFLLVPFFFLLLLSSLPFPFFVISPILFIFFYILPLLLISLLFLVLSLILHTCFLIPCPRFSVQSFSADFFHVQRNMVAMREERSWLRRCCFLQRQWIRRCWWMGLSTLQLLCLWLSPHVLFALLFLFLSWLWLPS